jgi:hypothetical protein
VALDGALVVEARGSEAQAGLVESGRLMGRIVEVLVGLNAIGGVLTFLGLRWGVRKARDKVLRREEEKPDVTIQH